MSVGLVIKMGIEVGEGDRGVRLEIELGCGADTKGACTREPGNIERGVPRNICKFVTFINE